MSNLDLTRILLLLLLLVGFAQIFGYVFVKVRQPRVVGEIFAGVVLGPALLGRFHFASGIATAMHQNETVFNLFYWLGLLLLMFLSGTEARQLFGREERADVLWLTLVGTGIPFLLGLTFGSRFIVPALMGPHGNVVSLTIVIAVGTAVTSVPVISKIFSDLKILQTRFARLVLGVAVLEDIVLWLALAVATGISANIKPNPREISIHLLSTVAFFVLGLTIIPRVIKRINKSPRNVVALHSPVAYVLIVLLTYCVVAGTLNVSMVFAAFLSGFAVVHKKRKLFDESLQAISKISFAFFIPVYFAIVGMKLNLTRGVSFWMLISFLGASCLIKVIAVGIAGYFAGFRRLDLINLAITTNARGGPGIVLASVAYEAGIISSQFYTTLVIAAVVTSQVAGAWLDYVLRKGYPLLESDNKVIHHPIEVNQTTSGV